MRDGEGEAGGVVDSPTVRRHPAVPALHHLHTVLYSATKRRFYIAYDRFIMVKILVVQNTVVICCSNERVFINVNYIMKLALKISPVHIMPDKGDLCCPQFSWGSTKKPKIC